MKGIKCLKTWMFKCCTTNIGGLGVGELGVFLGGSGYQIITVCTYLQFSDAADKLPEDDSWQSRGEDLREADVSYPRVW